MLPDPSEFKSCPIPPEFHSLELDGPFRHCLTCKLPLLESDRPYLIERIFRGAEPILEYAVCTACHEQLSDEISRESTRRINEYFSEQCDGLRLLRRGLELAGQDTADGVNPWLDQCIVTGADASQCHERQIYAYCQGDRLLLGGPAYAFPMMISGAAIEALAERLSEATRGWMDDFVGDHFGLSPDFIDAPDLLPVLL